MLGSSFWLFLTPSSTADWSKSVEEGLCVGGLPAERATWHGRPLEPPRVSSAQTGTQKA